VPVLVLKRPELPGVDREFASVDAILMALATVNLI
jgi:precorrin-6A/cobalt-precorrin-6A reductase